MKIRIHFDGACHNQVDKSMPMGIGVAVFLEDLYEEDLSRAIGIDPTKPGFKDRGTSNIAEWSGCVEAMKVAHQLRKTYQDAKIVVHSDSQVITSQFNGTYNINNKSFVKYRNEAVYFAEKAGINRIVWIPREENKEADKLSKIGLKSLIS